MVISSFTTRARVRGENENLYAVMHLKERFTQMWKFSYLLTYILMESQVKFSFALSSKVKSAKRGYFGLKMVFNVCFLFYLENAATLVCCETSECFAD